MVGLRRARASLDTQHARCSGARGRGECVWELGYIAGYGQRALGLHSMLGDSLEVSRDRVEPRCRDRCGATTAVARLVGLERR